jgi:hypothetical protein
MTTGVSQDTIWINRSRGQFRLIPRTGQPAQQQPANNPVPVGQPTVTSGGLSQREINRIKKEDKDKPLDEKSIYSIEEELSGILTKTTVSGETIYTAKTEFNGTDLVQHSYKFVNGKFVDTEDPNKTFKPSDLESAVEIAKAYLNFITNSSAVQCDAGQFNDDIKENSVNTFDDIEKTLNGLNKNNIIPFLRDYYEVTGYNGVHGAWKNGPLMRTEGGIDEKISMQSKLNLVKSLLDAAKDLGMEDCHEYQEILKMYTRYTEGRFKGAEDLTGSRNKAAERPFLRVLGNALGGAVAGALVGAGVGACCAGVGAVPGVIFGAIYGAVAGLVGNATILVAEVGPYCPRDCEKLDRLMYRLYEKIDQKLNPQEQQSYVLPGYIEGLPVHSSDTIREQNPPRRMMGVYEA